MSSPTQSPTPPDASLDAETVRCFECRQVWPRTAMRWGDRPTGPDWLSRRVRVWRCPDCLPA